MGTSGYSSGYYRVINDAWNVINNFLDVTNFQWMLASLEAEKLFSSLGLI